jgi:hypothetical protein
VNNLPQHFIGKGSDSMTDVEYARKQRNGMRQWSWLVLFQALVMTLFGLHYISSRWVILAFFTVIIPLGTLRIFGDLRRR